MARYELKIPKLGESVIEATVTAWLKNIGDKIEEDDGVLEVATDKVDTEIPCEVSGVLVERLFEVDQVAKVGQTVAILETDDINSAVSESTTNVPSEIAEEKTENIVKDTSEAVESIEQHITDLNTHKIESSQDRFYSPLVKSIAKTEGITQNELDNIQGSGLNGRVTKDDILTYLKNRSSEPQSVPKEANIKTQVLENTSTETREILENEEVISMGRMERLIADHMVHSVQTSAHVQSFIEIDVTKVVQWRERNKDVFFKQNGEKLTYTPIFMQAVAKTIREYPMVNISVEGTNIIKKNDINLGMATALPDGNLIVPVIKKADELSLVGMVKRVNALAKNARNNKLSPDDIQNGTYTVTNVGSFGSMTGTPIINQPQVAILALGAIRKVPAVLETDEGDVIAVRHQMIIAHSYDHRVINGALGGQFILKLKQLLENFNEDDL